MTMKRTLEMKELLYGVYIRSEAIRREEDKN